MKLPTLNDLNLTGKNLILRADLDVALSGQLITEEVRLQVLIPLLKDILKHKIKKVLIIGHLDRPEGQYKPEFSLLPIHNYLKAKLATDIGFIHFKAFLEQLDPEINIFKQSELKLFMLENLRFWTGEQANDPVFAQKLRQFGDCYLNEAFAASHRQSASVVALPSLLKKQVAFGPRFLNEITNLDKVMVKPKMPVILLLSGVKKDKLNYLESLVPKVDKVLVAGRLPEYLSEDYFDPKVIVARLLPDKEDITINSINKFIAAINSARTIIVSGPIGRFEEEGHRQGTKQIFEAVANSEAFKIAGGGDTIHALNNLKLKHKFNWISLGGGAMLEYLSKGTLPALKIIT